MKGNDYQWTDSSLFRKEAEYLKKKGTIQRWQDRMEGKGVLTGRAGTESCLSSTDSDRHQVE